MPGSNHSGLAMLDHLLAALDVGVAHFTTCDVRAGWAVEFDACEAASLHYCLTGGGVLAVPGIPPIRLAPHTFVLLAPGTPYRIGSARPSPGQRQRRPRLRCSPSLESVPTVAVGHGRQGISTICGEVSAGVAAGSRSFPFLGEPLVARFVAGDGLEDPLVKLLAESLSPRVGTRALSEALLKQCLVLALRRCMEQGESKFSWLAGLADARLSGALRVIFERPNAPLTVESLAGVACMSRSAFAAAFVRAFGISPMSLVNVVRLRRAGEQLATTALPVSQVAQQAGFASRSHFSQAFTRLHGVDPSRFRRESVGGPAVLAPRKPR
ncbi:helix-turn-helix transcriptional regulator [Bordetella flabilis]|uniref:Cupin n=1 Tax=Bordetella flabilis TaxID=463014 RepID=A0A193GGL0_9BORD|nr:AraC family transcriptional regulator [Bordetella flabilis]ANN78434.1 cupin [Bordetella flabilis]